MARTRHDSRDWDSDTAAEISLEGEAAITRDEIAIQPESGFSEKAAKLAFDQEPVKIIIHPDMSPTPEDPVMVSVNGRAVFIRRNEPTIVKRMYVEQLARAKTGIVSQPNANSQEPSEVNKLRVANSLRYPFSVLEDRNPKGARWINDVMRQAA
jgi:hypothetical protein